MPTPLVFNPDQTRTFDAPIRTIEVAIGSIIVTAGNASSTTLAGDTYEAGDTAGLSVYSPTSARVTVTFAEEAPMPAVRGDSGGSGGSYESRTVAELRKVARDRGIPGCSKLRKDALIEALRS